MPKSDCYIVKFSERKTSLHKRYTTTSEHPTNTLPIFRISQILTGNKQKNNGSDVINAETISS